MLLWILTIVENLKDETNYKILKLAYENFEDSSKTFFDGKR